VPRKAPCWSCLAFCSVDSISNKSVWDTVSYSLSNFVFFDFKIMGRGSPDNNLESPHIFASTNVCSVIINTHIRTYLNEYTSINSWIWGPHSGAYEEYYLLGYKTVWSGKCFGGTCRLHLQSERVSRNSTKLHDVKTQKIVLFTLTKYYKRSGCKWITWRKYIFNLTKQCYHWTRVKYVECRKWVLKQGIKCTRITPQPTAMLALITFKWTMLLICQQCSSPYINKSST
jgi:hypothetical protein